MKTYNQFFSEMKVASVVADVQRDINNLLKLQFSSSKLIKKANSALNRLDSKIDKENPPMVKRKGPSNRFNSFYFSLKDVSEYGAGDGDVRVKMILTSNFNNISYPGGGGWTPYVWSVNFIMNEDGNVTTIIESTFSVDKAIRKLNSSDLNVKKRAAIPLPSLLNKMIDTMIENASQDLLKTLEYVKKEKQY